jgi:hypothetical protein
MGEVEQDSLEGDTFFQLEEEEPLEFSEEPAKPEFKSEMEVTKDFLNKNLDILYGRLEKFTRSSGIKKQSTIESLQNKIVKLKAEIQNNEFEKGIIGVIELVKTDLEATSKILDKHLENDTVNTNTTEMVSGFVDIYSKLFDNFRENIEYYSFKNETKTRLNNYINDIGNKIVEVKTKNNTLTRRDNQIILKGANTDENGEKIDKDFDEKAILDSSESDLSVLRFWAGNFKNAKSSIIRAAFKLIHNSNIKVKRKAVEVAQELIAAQELMEKSGVKVKELVEKDSNGRPTQYLIREKNWAPYVEAKIKMQEELTKTLGFEEWMDVISAVRNKELSPEKLNIFKNTINKFQKDYPLVTVRDEKGNFLYKEPKEKNLKFEELMKNPLVKNYYDLLLKHRKEALDKLPLKYRKPANLYLLPGIRAQFIEKMFRADVPFHKNLAQIAAESLVRDQDDTEFGDDQSTLNNKMVPIYFTRRFRNEELSALSTDLTRSFTIFSEMAENLKEKGKLAGDLSSIQRQIENRSYIKSGKETPGAASNEFKALQFMLDSYVFGIEKKDVEFWKMGDNKLTRALGVANKSFSLRKLIDRFTRFIRNNNLALNIPTALAGYLKGNVDTLIEDQLGEYTTIESKNWARLEYGKNLGQVIAQIGKKTQTNKMHLLLRRNRIVDLNSILANTERSKLTSTLLNSDMLYVNYKTGDYGLKGRVALAVYHNTRLVDGKFLDKAEFRRLRRKEGKQEKEINKEWKSLEDKNLYNAFEVKNAQLVIKDEFKPFVTEGLENKIFSRIEYTANTIDGTMSDTDRGALSREIVGEFLLMHRGWFINMIDSRVRWFTSVDLMSGKEETGYYRALYDYIATPIRQDGFKAMSAILTKDYWKETKANSPGRAKGVKKALLDLLYLNVLGLIAALVNTAADDDEEEDYALQFSAYILNRVLLEHSAGNPVLNLSEIIQIIDEPVVGVRMIKDLIDLSEIWNPEIYESGMYENWSHREKWFFRKSAVLKNLYEVQFPELKNRFIKNQILDSYIYDKIKKDEDESMGIFERLKVILMSDHDADPIESYNIINDEYED